MLYLFFKLKHYKKFIIVLISSVEQSESVTHTHVSTSIPI